MPSSLKQLFKKPAVVAVAALILALLVFEAGVFVGYHKALFSYRGGERYMRMMEGPRGQVGPGRGQIHGATGKIVSASLPTFVVLGPDSVEKTVMVDASTTIAKFREATSSAAIREGDMAFVLGDPDASGIIRARFVRILPANFR